MAAVELSKIILTLKFSIVEGLTCTCLILTVKYLITEGLTHLALALKYDIHVAAGL